MEKNLTLTTAETKEPIQVVPIVDGDSVTRRITVARAYKDWTNAHTANEKAKTFKVVFDYVCDKTATTVFLGLLNLIPLYILIVGAVHFHNCPIEDMIPVYLVVDGAVFLARTGIFFCIRHDPTVAGNQYWKMAPKIAVNLFLFIWLICGSIWIFGNFPNFDDVDAPNHCNKLAYISAYVYVIVQWIAFPLGILIGSFILVSSIVATRTSVLLQETPVEPVSV